MKRTIVAAALFAAMAGSAFAQQAADTQGNSPDYFTDPAMVGSFYTDDTMTTLRPSAEMRPAYDALSEEQREALQYQCEQEASRGTEATALCSEVTTYK